MARPSAFLAAVIFVGLSFPGTPARADDSAMVYCLGHEEDLVRAAVALGLGDSGASPAVLRISGVDMRADQWRRARPDDFQRTCAALRGAAGSPASARPGNLSLLITAGTTLLSASLGAGFTWLVTSGRDRAAQRRQEAQDLRLSVQAFVAAVRVYASAWLGRKPAPSETPVVERLADLEAKLRRIDISGHRSPAPGRLLARLGAAPFGPGLVDFEKWSTSTGPQRTARADEISASLDKFARDAEHVAYRHERNRRRAQATAETG